MGMSEQWLADLADLSEGRDYVAQWEAEHGPIYAATEDRDEWEAEDADVDEDEASM